VPPPGVFLTAVCEPWRAVAVLGLVSYQQVVRSSDCGQSFRASSASFGNHVCAHRSSEHNSLVSGSLESFILCSRLLFHHFASIVRRVINPCYKCGFRIKILN
jgi:hypothetical protein